MTIEKVNHPEWLQVYQKTNGMQVMIIVHIRNNATGKIKEVYTLVPVEVYSDEEKIYPNLFKYTEDNGNRHYLFSDVEGSDFGIDVGCNDKTAYSIRILNPATKKFIYEEFDKEGKPIDPPYHFLDQTQES